MPTDDILRVRAHSDLLVDAATVQASLDELAARLTARVQHADPLLLCVMNGGLFTTSELAHRCDFALQMDFVQVSRYGDATEGGALRFLAKPRTPLADRTVVLLDDILDRGETLAALLDWAQREGAGEVLSAVLVDKRVPHARGVRADFAALTVDDRYLFGCGMDYRGYWRNLPAIYGVRPDYLASLAALG